MEELFGGLGRALEGMPLVALGAALGWGVLSVVLSPCHLASIPLVVGFVSGGSSPGTARAFRLSLAFALGVLVTLAAAGALALALGRLLGDLGGWSDWLAAAVFLLVGLYLLEVAPLPGGSGLRAMGDKRGYPAALALGLVFGLALGPCAFAFMAPVLGVALRAAASAPLWSALLLAAYALGHILLIVLAGTFTGAVGQYLQWSGRSRALLLLRRGCGVLVLLGGLYLLYTA